MTENASLTNIETAKMDDRVKKKVARKGGKKREKERKSELFSLASGLMDGSLHFILFFYFFLFRFLFFFFLKDTKSRTNDWTILGRKSTHESPIDLKLCHSWKMFKRKTKEEITVSSSMRVSSLHVA